MKILCYELENDYSVDVFMRTNEERYKTGDSAARMIVTDLIQKKILLDDGKVLLIVMLDYNLPFDFTPKWLLALGMRKSLANAGYKGRFKKVSYKNCLRGVLR